jgi:hypothetical protein
VSARKGEKGPVACPPLPNEKNSLRVREAEMASRFGHSKAQKNAAQSGRDALGFLKEAARPGARAQQGRAVGSFDWLLSVED